jgi:hypothetical protein
MFRMLLVDGPARGIVVGDREFSTPVMVAPDITTGADPSAPLPDPIVYYPRRFNFLGHAVRIGVSGSALPDPASMFDLLASGDARQCEVT